MQDLLEAGNRHAATVGMHINVSRAKAMSALTPGEQRQAVLLDGDGGSCQVQLYTVYHTPQFSLYCILDPKP